VVYLSEHNGFDTINGRAFIGNTPTFHAKVGDLVQWDVLTIGENFHVFHIHGHRWRDPSGRFVDSQLLGPSTTLQVRFLVDAPGTRNVWTNVGRKRHTVTADTGSFDSGTLLPGETFSYVVPMSVGSFTYHCRFHQYIRGSVTVSVVKLNAPAEVGYGHGA